MDKIMLMASNISAGLIGEFSSSETFNSNRYDCQRELAEAALAIAFQIQARYEDAYKAHYKNEETVRVLDV